MKPFIAGVGFGAVGALVGLAAAGLIEWRRVARRRANVVWGYRP